MNATVEVILKEVNDLAVSEKAELIEGILASFSPKQSNEDLWKAEVESRIAAFDKGLLKAHSVSDAFKRLSLR